MSKNEILVKAPAKVNLFLEVLHKRDDGYHEIETIMQTIDLCDEINISLSNHPTQLTCNIPRLSVGSDNLVLRAIRALELYTGRSILAQIYLNKQIPIAAGLGGGSSDAAAVVLGLNQLLDLCLSREAIVNILQPLGADIPYFVYAGMALCTGIGQHIHPISDRLTGGVVLVSPCIDIPQKTKTIYQALDVGSIQKREDYRLLFNNIQNMKYPWYKHIFNRLEEVVLKLYPELAKIKEKMEELLGIPVLLSGGGPTFYCLVMDPDLIFICEAKLKKHFHNFSWV